MQFLSTLSLRRATDNYIQLRGALPYFYPRSPCGERHDSTQQTYQPNAISIHALLAESDNSAYGALDGASISIHALLAESDWWLRCWQLAARDISIHALLAESDNTVNFAHDAQAIFLSTLSLRRATVMMFFDYAHPGCISIHALLAESDSFRVFYWLKVTISIHALLAESDLRHKQKFNLHLIFLSTLSLRRATPPVRDIIQWEGIFLSTLSLRRATQLQGFLLAQGHNFYPRSPCGERLEFRKLLYPGTTNFYPRSPCGERLLLAM